MHHKEVIFIVDLIRNVAVLVEELETDKTQKTLQRTNLMLQKTKQEFQLTL